MSERYDGQTYYELLEITPQAGPADIYNAYQRAKSTYSTNSPAIYSMFTPQEAQELMALIEEAYQTLSHQARRKEYDLKIGLSQPPVKSAHQDPTQFSRASVTGTANSSSQRSARGDEQWLGPVKVISRGPEIPEGYARTKFSLYEINTELEQELQNIETCDGAFLKKMRLYRGVSLEQISEEIRVSKSTLMALEANELNSLPVAVFTRGFVAQMARALQLPERKVTDAYMKFFRSQRP